MISLFTTSSTISGLTFSTAEAWSIKHLWRRMRFGCQMISSAYLIQMLSIPSIKLTRTPTSLLMTRRVLVKVLSSVKTSSWTKSMTSTSVKSTPLLECFKILEVSTTLASSSASCCTQDFKDLFTSQLFSPRCTRLTWGRESRRAEPTLKTSQLTMSLIEQSRLSWNLTIQTSMATHPARSKPWWIKVKRR